MVFFVSCLAAVVLSELNPVPDASRPFEPWTLLRVVPRGAAPPILASMPSAAASPSKTPTHAAKSPSATPSSSAVGSSSSATAPPVTQQQGGGPMPDAPAGFTTVFSDNFAGPAGSAPSSQNWFYDIGTGFGNNEVQQTTSSTSNTYLDGQGDLVLQANQSNGSWTSAQIESARDDFAAPAGGKMEMSASIQQPNVANPLGYWPAFWALGAPMRTGGGWPQSGEIDMLEDINGLNTASQTFHYGNSSQLSPGMKSCQGGSTCQTGFHTYSVLIDRTNTSAETLQFLLDGTVQATYTEAQVGTATWQAAIDHGFFIILDLAMGGTWPNGQCNCTSPTSGTTSGGTMRVGYVAVYEQGGNSTPAGTVTASGRITGPGGKCLSNANSLPTPYNPISLSDCDGSAGQQWSVYSDGTLRTQGGCLDIGGKTSGSQVGWYPCTGSSTETWTRQSNGEFYNSSSGLCLSSPGTAPQLQSCSAAADQKWTVT